MASIGSLVAAAFYIGMFGALLFFAHKILWFVQLRRLQARLVEEALRRLERRTGRAVDTWDRDAAGTWNDASETLHDKRPDDYCLRVERTLEALRHVLRDSFAPARESFLDALLGRIPSTPLKSVLSIPRLDGSTTEIKIDLSLPAVREAEPPDPRMYQLKVRSRYGLTKRLLVLFLGAVDVVYSSQHVALMTQNQQVPIGLIVRRLSLVVLVLLVVMVDVTISARKRLILWVEEHLATQLKLDFEGPFVELINEQLPTITALGGWLAVYGLLYLGLYVYLRRRAGHHLEQLREMDRQRARDIQRIVDAQREQLWRWGSEYARALDDATEIAIRQAELLLSRTTHRLRRRMASVDLLAHADRVAASLFARLPESSNALQDSVTQHRHSFRHLLWPRAEEMEYQVDLSQYRAAWRYVESTANDLRGEKPDPVKAHELWRTLVSYAEMFPDIVPAGTPDELKHAYENMARAVVAETEIDLSELDQRLAELASSLSATFRSANALAESQIELTSDAIAADVSALVAEVVRVRELARLEAMAFEI